MKSFKSVKRTSSTRGNVLLLTIVIVAVLLLTTAHVFKNAFPRYVTTVQVAAWQESRLAADAGVDLGLAALKANLPTPNAGTSWTGWTTTSGTSASNITTALTTGSTATISSTSGAVVGFVSSPIFYSKTLPSTSGSTQVDIQISALYPDSTIVSNTSTAYRIRSMGTSTAGTPSRLPVDRMDASLLRFNLFGGYRAAFSSTTLWGTSNFPAILNSQSPFVPYVSRIVEAIVTPVVSLPFQYALHTNGALSLPNSQNYKFASWDSSTQGATPPSGSPVDTGASNYSTSLHKKANVGTNSNATPALSIPKSPEVYGNVSVGVGGTVDNVGGYSGTLSYGSVSTPVISAPSGASSWTSLSSNGTVTVNGNSYYYASVDPRNITFTGSGNVTIVVNAGWSASSITIPSNVKVTIYVNGSLSFGNGSINATGAPSNLIIIGTADASTNPVAFQTTGNPMVSALFYGPTYAVSWSGGGNGYFRGAIVADTYTDTGGGGSSFLFDEAAAKISVGGVSYYKVSNYFEDSRQ